MKSKAIYVRVPLSLLRSLNARAAQEKRTRSNLIVYLLSEAVKARRQGSV